MTIFTPGDSQPKSGKKAERKLVFMLTHGPEHPETATIPFAMAVAAQSAGVEVLLGFQVEGVRLPEKGVAEKVAAPHFTPLKDLMDIYHSNGGVYYACGPCVATRNIPAENFVEGAQVVNAATFVEQFITANNVLVY